MSFKAIEWVYTLNLPPSEKLILAYLAYRADNKGICFPFVNTIQEACSVSRSTVFRVLLSLSTKGLLQIVTQKQRKSSLYVLSIGVTLTPHQCHSDTSTCHHDTPYTESSSNLHSESSEASGLASKNLKKEAKKIFGDEMKKENFMNVPMIYSIHKIDINSALDKAKIQPNGFYKPKALETLWKDLNEAYETGVFIPAATQKQLGQFGHYAKKSGKRAVAGILAVVKSWSKFGSFVVKEGLSPSFPTKPHMGFFLKHYESVEHFLVKLEEDVKLEFIPSPKW